MIAPVTCPIRSSSLHPAIALVNKFPSEASSPSAIRPDYLSPSSVKSYLSCSLRFFFERVAQIRKPTTVAPHVGKAIHATLQSFNLARWREEDSSETAMEEAFSAHFLELEKTEGPVDYVDEETRQKIRSCAFDHELQLVTYQMMIEEATGDTPPSLDLIYLVKTKMPQVIRVKIHPANEQRKQRIADLYRIACEGITTERFHPQPGMQCSWCQYRKECSGWCRQ
ncbi:hypothetical protein CXU13_04085 [Akkermansia muciniphila]|nr:hypothetical protein CXU13_04085 [Akkermansia muciniphila]